MKSAQTIINNLIGDTIREIEAVVDISSAATDAVAALAPKLIQEFAWHPIKDVDLYRLREVPTGKRWGPRVIVIANGTPAVAYWDPDQVQPDGRPVASPQPYWRTVQKTAGWSRKATVTHFLRPYSPL